LKIKKKKGSTGQQIDWRKNEWQDGTSGSLFRLFAFQFFIPGSDPFFNS